MLQHDCYEITPPRFELGSPAYEASMLTITPQGICETLEFN